MKRSGGLALPAELVFRPHRTPHGDIHVYRGLQWRHIHFPESRHIPASSVAGLVTVIRFFCHSSAQRASRRDVAARPIGRHSDAGGFSAERLVCKRGVAAQRVFDSHHQDKSEMRRDLRSTKALTTPRFAVERFGRVCSRLLQPPGRFRRRSLYWSLKAVAKWQNGSADAHIRARVAWVFGQFADCRHPRS